MLTRPRVSGKFISVDCHKFYVRGVSYGAFRPNESGEEYGDIQRIACDFAQMAANGINTVRIPHTVPPCSLLDIAQQYKLRVMVGLSAEQYAGYLIDRKGAPDIIALTRQKVRTIAGHPALLCYALGNELPASTVRWLGHRRVELYLQALYDAVKEADPDALVTYVNYPTTEYLQLPFLDLVCFNVYLESQERLEAYLPRLQNIAGDRPLVLSEVGLDGLRNGAQKQADVLEWQLRTAFRAGCAGAVVFSWTDEWYRAGADVEDWAFGITDRARNPKPALAAVRNAFAQIPPPLDPPPRITVIICSLNGARTLRQTLDAVVRLEYPDYEVIVVDDGSRDATAAIAAEYGIRVISTHNQGPSCARNTGAQAATGEIIGYLDDDAFPDPDWLTFLALTFSTTDYVAVGGPNIPPADDGLIAKCVASAPGNPTHVLLSDQEAEHIPGCNFAIRKDCLEAIGGFDCQFRVAGDDVDACWRLQERGWKLGFSPAAMVWHHRRNSIRAYWKQQVGYGKAEALLERKWPQRFNSLGHLTWGGRMYGRGFTASLFRPQRIYQGVHGEAPYQSIYEPTPSPLSSLLLMPEWYLVMFFLGALSLLGISWQPLVWALPLFALAVSAFMLQAICSVWKAKHDNTDRSRLRFAWVGITTFLQLLQPLARLTGRMRVDLAPRSPHGAKWTLNVLPRARAIWVEQGHSGRAYLASIAARLQHMDAVVQEGDAYNAWDLQVFGGGFGSARMLMAVEDFGGGKQYVRYRTWAHWAPHTLILTALMLALAIGAGIGQSWMASITLLVAAAICLFAMLRDASIALTALWRAVDHTHAEASP